MDKPIFYDPTGRRKRASFIGVVSLVVLATLLFVGLVLSILIVPVPEGLDLRMEYPKLHASRIPLGHAEARIRPLTIRHGKPLTQQALAGFYLSGDDASLVSLQKHVNNLDIVIPSLAFVGGTDNRFIYSSDDQFTSTLLSAKHRPDELVMVQNLIDGTWQGANTAKLLADRGSRDKLIAEIATMLRAEKAQGVVFDFETMPDEVLPGYVEFLRQARAYLSTQGYLVAATAPVDSEAWDLKAFASATDRLFLMIYDQHSMVDPAGPIAAQGWFNARLQRALQAVPPSKAIICIGNYAYDWHPGTDGKTVADPSSVEEAWTSARESDASILFDRVSGNAHFSYDEDNQHHEVWLLDAVSAWNQLLSVDHSGASGVALWRLGSEDSSIWKAFAAYRSNEAPDLNELNTVGDTEVVGNGEIVHVDATPHSGKRAVTFDRLNVAQNEDYLTLPTPYVVHRTGYRPGDLALTFDDGPDARWTPEILRVLEREHVPATFFVIGEKAIEHPDLLRRMMRDGDDIGNHSYTHPDMSKVPEWQARFELNSTQRVIEAYTGHAMRLVRNPYFGDAEPTSVDELGPVLTAQELGYTNVGLHVDAEDWTRPGVQQIIDNTVNGVHDGVRSEQSPLCRDQPDECRSGQIILLHDSGGDRAQTLAALPIIIEKLRAEGFRFVTVGDMTGLPSDQVMPKLKGQDLAEVRFDVGIFMTLAWTASALKWLFVVAIILGIGRALILSVLAIWAEYTDHMEPPGNLDHVNVARFLSETFVSVVIPAFNEERVIEASVRRVLGSVGIRLEVIVVDDGSKDATSEVVARAFGNEDRVSLITQPNRGKANAVNAGIAAARGDIIIALDADTQFEAETIARLVRWFVRPEIGAVAGNAKVGNRFNFVTRWQAVEYVTAQNLERSALATFGAMMVVPGAVGAWRRAAIQEVGGYPANTLAEDQDLTIAVQRRHWRVAYDQEAVAWTEAPESYRDLVKQRFRWAFGTLQCLWKHRGVMRTGTPKGLAFIGMPQAWVFQIGFSLISPIIDFALVINIFATVVRVAQHGWAQNDTDLGRMLAYWLTFLAIDALCGAIAYWLEPREKSYPVFWLLSQRFVYRQVMYYVVIRAMFAALRGLGVGWGKFERSGRFETKVKA